MKLFKAKVEKTTTNELTQLPSSTGGFAVKISSIYFQTKNPNAHLMLFDGDGDQFIFPIPGQVDPKPVVLESPVAVKGPISYVDTFGGNPFIIWGELETLETRTPSSFSR